MGGCGRTDRGGLGFADVVTVVRVSDMSSRQNIHPPTSLLWEHCDLTNSVVRIDM